MDGNENDRIQAYEPQGGGWERRKLDFLAPTGLQQEEQTIDVVAYWQAILKRRWTVLTVLFVTFTLVVVWTLKQQRVYRADALIEIGKNSDVAAMPGSNTGSTAEDPVELDTQIEILHSKTLARRVFNDLHLSQVPEFNPGGKRGTNRQAGPTDATIKSFMSGLEINPLKGTRLVKVGYDATDPAMAARIANSFAKNYIDLNLEAHWQSMQVTSEWLGQKLNETRISLEKAEEKLQQYARNNGLFFMVNKSDEPEALVAARLQLLQDAMGKAETARFKQEWLAELAQKEDYTSTNAPGIFEDSVTQNLEQRITALQAKRAQMLSTFTTKYPKVKELQFQIDALQKMLTQERKRVAQSTAQTYKATLTREKLLRRAFKNEQQQANAIAERAVHYNILRRDVDTNRQLYNGLLQHLKEMGITASLKASTIRVVDAAEPPPIPFKPRITLNLIMGLVLGLGLGVGAALAQEMLDRTLKNSEDVERYLNLACLAMIPSAELVDGRRGAGAGRLVNGATQTEALEGSPEKPPLPGTVQSPWYRIDNEEGSYSHLAEAFRNLRTSVLLSAADRPPRSLLICSAQPGEGKTTVAVNLAVSLAQLGERVLLIDCDLRRPSVHKALGLKAGTGLVHYLTGQREWKAVVQPSGVSGVDVLVCGPIPPNPAELLSSERMRSLMRLSIEEYNFVVVDSPPVLTVTDGRILMPLVEGVVMVIAGGVTPRQFALRAQRQAREVGGNIVGVVLNRVDTRHDGYYGYYYAEDSAEARDEVPISSAEEDL